MVIGDKVVIEVSPGHDNTFYMGCSQFIINPH